MSVAVVVPTKDGAPFIAAAVRSVLDQTRAPEQFVVVDDGSTDDTPNIVTAIDPSIPVVANQGTGGSRGRATGVAATDSTYVAFLDHDDTWEPDHLEHLVGLLEQDSEGVVAFRC